MYPFKCGNYGIGGHYWTHPDYFTKEQTLNKTGNIGNRAATIITVLEAPVAGILLYCLDSDSLVFVRKKFITKHCLKLLITGGATV